MKDAISIIVVLFCAGALCYGSYEEGRFQERWQRAPKVSYIDTALSSSGLLDTARGLSLDSIVTK